jgi:hypothetical protein
VDEGRGARRTDFIYVDPQNELLVVLRWIDRAAIDGVVQRLLAARR